jgi:hypothetical protein
MIFIIMYPSEEIKGTFTQIPPKSLTTGMTLSTNAPRDRKKSIPLQWQREEKGVWKDMSTTHEYLLTADDVGKRIRVKAKGDRISDPTNIVEFASTVLSHSRAMTRASTFRFKAGNKLGGTVWTITGNAQGLTMKSSVGTVRTAKWSTVECECVPGTSEEMVLHTDQSSKFPLIPNLSDDRRLEGLLGLTNIRDYVVAIIRGFVEFHSK